MPGGIFCMRMFVSRDEPNLLNRRVGAPAPTATVNKQKITKRTFDGRALHGLKFTLCICSVNFMFSRRPTARHSPSFSTAERPVCVPYNGMVAGQ